MCWTQDALHLVLVEVLAVSVVVEDEVRAVLVAGFDHAEEGLGRSVSEAKADVELLLHEASQQLVVRLLRRGWRRVVEGGARRRDESRSSAAILEVAVQLVAAVLARTTPVLVVEAVVDTLATNTGTTSPSLRWSPSLRRRRPCCSWRWRRWWGAGVLVAGHVVGQAAEGVDDAAIDSEGEDVIVVGEHHPRLGGSSIKVSGVVRRHYEDVEAPLERELVRAVVADEQNALDVVVAVRDALDVHLVAGHRAIPRRSGRPLADLGRSKPYQLFQLVTASLQDRGRTRRRRVLAHARGGRRVRVDFARTHGGDGRGADRIRGVGDDLVDVEGGPVSGTDRPQLGGDRGTAPALLAAARVHVVHLVAVPLIVQACMRRRQHMQHRVGLRLPTGSSPSAMQSSDPWPPYAILSPCRTVWGHVPLPSATRMSSMRTAYPAGAAGRERCGNPCSASSRVGQAREPPDKTKRTPHGPWSASSWSASSCAFLA